MKYRKTIVGNWKMNKTRGEAVAFIQSMLDLLGPKFNDVDVIICPSFTCIQACVDALGGRSAMAIGAQNVHEETSGPYTGEVSASMLRDLFCRYVIVGHSERRTYFGEHNTLVNAKAKASILSKLRPIVCVGETLEERDKGKTEEVLNMQTEESLAQLSDEQWGEILIAYEPVWAIGTGRTATPEQAQEAHRFIREKVRKMTNPAIAEKIRILYGGSVKPENTAQLMHQPDINGALVGGGSLEVRSFLQIIQNSIIEG